MRHLWPLVCFGTGWGMYGVELYAAVRLTVVEEGLGAPRRGRDDDTFSLNRVYLGHDTPSLHDRLLLGDALERIRPLRLRGKSGVNDLEYGRVAALLKQVEQCRNRFGAVNLTKAGRS